MIGIACGEEGLLKVIDLDVIEISNLNRQFLYRSSDVKKMKAQVSSEATKKMNSKMNISVHTTKICEENQNYYNNKFFEPLDGVFNALDNVAARRYVDSQCVFYQKPLLESGTEGLIGSTQVILPHLTQTFSDTAMIQTKNYPKCLISSFPTNIGKKKQNKKLKNIKKNV